MTELVLAAIAGGAFGVLGAWVTGIPERRSAALASQLNDGLWRRAIDENRRVGEENRQLQQRVEQLEAQLEELRAELRAAYDRLRALEE